MNESQHHEGRSQERHEINSTVEVYDAGRNEYLGRLVNIHTEGMMVAGQGQMLADHVYQLELRLKQPVNGFDSIRMGVDCLWSRQEEDSKLTWAGCHIIDLSETARGRILSLIGSS